MITVLASCAEPSGKPELLTDPRFADNVSRVVNVTALTAVLEQAFSARTAGDWVKRLQQAGVACGVVNTIKQAVEDPQIAARDMIVRAGPMRMPGNPVKFRGRDESGERNPAPAFDADGAAIRKEFAPGKGPT